MLLLLLLLLEEVVKPSVELTELVELSVERLDTVLNPTTIESACSKGRREFRISASSLALKEKTVNHHSHTLHFVPSGVLLP